MIISVKDSPKNRKKSKPATGISLWRLFFGILQILGFGVTIYQIGMYVETYREGFEFYII